MPPHCDSVDGPVAKAAMRALDAENIDLVLPYVYEAGEGEVRKAFAQVIPVRKDGQAARQVADLYFLETVVRIHRQGEGAPYTGLKPAGLDVGPVIPVAERAIERGSPEDLSALLSTMVRRAIERRFAHMLELRAHADDSVEAAREYVEAMLGLQVYSHKLYKCIQSDPHEGHHEDG